MEKRISAATGRTLGSAISALLLLATAPAAWAGPLRINFGPDPALGLDWDGSFDDQINVDGQNFSGDLSPFSSQGSLPPPTETSGAFATGLLIGGVSYDTFCVSEQGRTWFASGADACTFDYNDPDDVALFSPLGGAWDYTFDPTVPPTTDPGFDPSVNESSVSVSLGLQDRDLDGDGVFDLADAAPALRVWWRYDETATTPTLDFQMLIYDTGGGNFDVEFNYDGDYSALGVQSIIAPNITAYLGDPALTGALTDPFFRFVDGQLSIGSGPPTSVPEPATLSLLATGIFGLLGVTRRKRRAALQAAR